MEVIETKPKTNVGMTEALGDEASYPKQPRNSGDTAFLLGMEWTVADDENLIKAAMEQWVRRGALRAAADAYANGDMDSASALREVYGADFAAGRYNWGGKHVASACRSPDGMMHFFYLLLLRCHPNITPDVVRAMFKSDIEECLRCLNWALGNLPTLSVGRSEGVTAEEIAA